MRVVAEFEKPERCIDCPCFYETEGCYKNVCQLTNIEIVNPYVKGFIDKSCPLKAKEDYVKQSDNAH